ncbi:hypothetical protein Athai_62590 [Actinocatenispora thailandica]|uniref:Polysaccharide biosynthesis protein n=1 Tax=Actinocatenispora thailandica TaxID=227318 RepID=A0A7R7DW35_9ACTN|nr:hypothetical protein [Actinocatenispora thailandica]BCJ38756.1 hypothetical protein Athai_62590 [Actinocatenispora thailandica]
MSGLRGRTVAGLADQALVALTTAGTGLLGTSVLPVGEAGLMLYAVAVLMFVQGLGRAFVGDVLLAHVPRFAAAGDRHRQFANAHATSGLLGLLGVVVLLAGWLLGPRHYVGDLVWCAPFVPSILLQDLARYTYQSRGRQSQALIIDGCWVIVQGTCVAVLLLTGHVGGGPLIACWGIGATAGALVFYGRTRINPLAGRPARWLRDTRHLLGWFTGTGVLAQLTTLLIASLVQGILSATAYSGLRLVQIVVLQPAQSFTMALNGLLVPRASALAGAGDPAGLRRQTRTVLAVNAAIGAGIVAVAVPLAHPVLSLYRSGAYLPVAAIALPIALQACLYLLQIPFTVAMRGMHRARMLFAQYVVYSSATLGGLVLGALLGGLPGAAWGLMSGAAVGTAVQASLYRIAVRALATVAGTPGAVAGGSGALAG